MTKLSIAISAVDGYVISIAVGLSAVELAMLSMTPSEV